MKVIFLDFDGVLVTAHDRFTAGSPFCVSLLNHITYETGAKLVVSSMWRIGRDTEELQTLLKEWEVEGECIGKTPVMHDKERGDEIQAWLDEHSEVTSFVILDDDSDMAHLRGKWVKCHAYHGIDEAQSAEAIAMLSETKVSATNSNETQP